jgi:2',3'-cyclic-nucleotide 2'-phosphodiesterase (5'-nucleotidase family)
VELSILHTNDMHGTLTQERFEKLLAKRQGVDLYFDSGDMIKTGNLGVPLRPDPAWLLLDELKCDASVLGNRETHPWVHVFEAKISGVSHPLLCANLRSKGDGYPLRRSLILERSGARIGVVGVMVPMVTERMRTQSASAYLWDPPVAAAVALAEELRPSCDLLIALTHIGYREDVRLAESGKYDILLGGHSHTVLQTPVQIGKTWVCQGGSHNRFVGRYRWNGSLSGGLEALR